MVALMLSDVFGQEMQCMVALMLSDVFALRDAVHGCTNAVCVCSKRCSAWLH